MSFYSHPTAYSNIPGSSTQPFNDPPYPQVPNPYNPRQPSNQVSKRASFDSTSSYGRPHGQHARAFAAGQHHQGQQQKPPPHMRPTAMNYKQFSAPPQHPAIRERSRSRSPVRNHSQLPPSYPNTQPHPQPMRYPYTQPSAATAYQSQPYQSPYAGSSTGTGVRSAVQVESKTHVQQYNMPATTTEQALRQVIPPTALYLQNIYSPPVAQQTHAHHQPRGGSVGQITQPPSASAYHHAAPKAISTPTTAPIQQPAHQSVTHPRTFPTSIAGVSIGSSSPPKSHAAPAPNPTVGTRRPLPQPGQGSTPVRSRPMSMPPQTSAQLPTFSPPQQSQNTPSHRNVSSISSLQAIINRPSNLQRHSTQTDLTTSPPAATAPPMRRAGSYSPVRNAKGLPNATASSALPTSGQLVPSQTGLPRISSIQFGVAAITSSPEKHPGPLPPSSNGTVPVEAQQTQTSPSQTQRRALPPAPTRLPDLSKVKQMQGPRTLERRSTVSQVVSKLNGSEQASPAMPASSSQSIEAGPVTSPIKVTGVSTNTSQRASVSPAIQDRPSISSDSNEEEDEDEYVSAHETGTSSQSDVKKSPQYGILDLPRRKTEEHDREHPSPQYGIRDLPTREERQRGHELERKREWVFGRKVQQKPLQGEIPTKIKESDMADSPQYGIRDLPSRTKSVVERRRAWERVDEGMNANVISRPATTTSSGPRAPSSSPTRVTDRSAPPASSSIPSLAQPSRAPVLPAQSPQPQVPQQTRKFPMPAVQHPKPSRTGRTPSWTLPTADLETLAASKNEEPAKTSMAMKFAAMSMKDEESNGSSGGLEALQKRLKRGSAFNTPTIPEEQSGKVTGRAFSRTHAHSKSLPFTSRVTHRNTNLDLSLDDAPPAAIPRPSSRARSRSQSPSRSPVNIPIVQVPDNDPPPSPVQVPVIHIPGEPDLPSAPPIPVIKVPGDDASSLPSVSISTPESRTSASVPIILEDLANAPSPTKRGLPRAPASSSSTSASTPNKSPSIVANSPSGHNLSETSSTKSNLRSRGGGLVCGGCGEGIVGRIVSAMGVRWHPQCFRCCTCGEHLEHVSSYEHDGKPYCHLDYHEVSCLH